MSLYRLLYEKPCHLLVKLEHKAYKAFDIKNLKNKNIFKVNGHHLKAYFDDFYYENKFIGLNDLNYKIDIFFSYCFVFHFYATFRFG